MAPKLLSSVLRLGSAALCAFIQEPAAAADTSSHTVVPRVRRAM
jgi:hypothetical protein